MSKKEDKELEKLKNEKIKEIMAKNKEREFPNSPLTVTDANFKNVIKKYPLVVIDFWAEWCSACKPMSPVIERLAGKYSGEVVFGKLNIDNNKRIPNKFQINSIPTLLFVKKGSPIDKIVGTVSPKSLEQKLRKYID